MAKMKAYATFDAYLEDQSPRNQAIIRALRAVRVFYGAMLSDPRGLLQGKRRRRPG